MPLIKYCLDDAGVATITLNRDDKRNAMNREMAGSILAQLDKASASGARVVVLRANAGVDVWCAGHDLSELEMDKLPEQNPTLAVADKIQAVPFPVIAMVEGRVFGGGMLLLLYADLVVAAENADVAITSNKIGIPLSPELHAFWLRVMGIHKAKELLFTADTIPAQDAYHAGLYNHVVKKQQLEEFVTELAARIVRCAPAAIAGTKRQLNLLARQSGLSDLEHGELLRANAAISGSDETKARIAALFHKLGENAAENES